MENQNGKVRKKNNSTKKKLIWYSIFGFCLTEDSNTNQLRLQLTQRLEVRRQSNHFINISRILRFLILVFVFDRELLNHLAGRWKPPQGPLLSLQKPQLSSPAKEGLVREMTSNKELWIMFSKHAGKLLITFRCFVYSRLF